MELESGSQISKNPNLCRLQKTHHPPMSIKKFEEAGSLYDFLKPFVSETRCQVTKCFFSASSSGLGRKKTPVCHAIINPTLKKNIQKINHLRYLRYLPTFFREGINISNTSPGYTVYTESVTITTDSEKASSFQLSTKHLTHSKKSAIFKSDL